MEILLDTTYMVSMHLFVVKHDFLNKKNFKLLRISNSKDVKCAASRMVLWCIPLSFDDEIQCFICKPEHNPKCVPNVLLALLAHTHK